MFHTYQLHVRAVFLFETDHQRKEGAVGPIARG